MSSVMVVQAHCPIHAPPSTARVSPHHLKPVCFLISPPHMRHMAVVVSDRPVCPDVVLLMRALPSLMHHDQE